MNNQIFVPITDDLIYDHPEQIEGPLIPYNIGMECQNWLTIELNPDDSEVMAIKSDTKPANSRVNSGLRVAYNN